MAIAAELEFYSPPRVAKILGVGHDKILSWIHNKELKAYDCSTQQGGRRPRYRISRAELDAFLARRAATPPPKKPRRRKPQQVITEYYT